jgi:hypothetical protein
MLKYACGLGCANKGAICRCKDNKFEGGTSRKPIFFNFWPNKVPKKVQLGVFGRSGAIGAIYLAF